MLPAALDLTAVTATTSQMLHGQAMHDRVIDINTNRLFMAVRPLGLGDGSHSFLYIDPPEQRWRIIENLPIRLKIQSMFKPGMPYTSGRSRMTTWDLLQGSTDVA